MPSEEALRRRLTAEGAAQPTYAVVLPLVREREGYSLLVEVRARGIPQAGDPCFPGGRIEAGETPAMAASREMAEELGLRVPAEEFLGRLTAIRNREGRWIDACVCTLTAEEADRARSNPAEVAALLRVPLPYFLERPQAREFPWEGHVIWGLTAIIIQRFCTLWRELEQEEAPPCSAP